MRYQLVIFDFDGVLADSAAWFLETFNHVAARHGFRQVDADSIDDLRSMSSREIIRALGVPLWRMPLIARDMRNRSSAAADRITLFPEIDALLTELGARGAQIAIASSNSEAAIRRILGANLAGAINQFECGSSLFGKARRIKRILRRSGQAATEAIFIGDETRDIEAAQDAGVAAGAVLWGYAKSAAFDSVNPVARFATVQEMRSFLLQ